MMFSNNNNNSTESNPYYTSISGEGSNSNVIYPNPMPSIDMDQDQQKWKLPKPTKEVGLSKYCCNHCFVSRSCHQFDFCLNEFLYCVNGGYIHDPDDEIYENVPKKNLEQEKFEFIYTKKKEQSICQKLYSLGPKCFSKIVNLFYLCAGSPDCAAWDYRDIENRYVDPKRGITLTGKDQDSALKTLILASDNGDTIQIGDINIKSIQGVSKTNLAHCLIVIDMKWLLTGEISRGNDKMKDLWLFQSTINKIQNGVNGRAYKEAINMYQFSSIKKGTAWAFLLKLSEGARDKFNGNRNEVRKFLDGFRFLKNGMANSRYSMSTIVRDYCIIQCLSGCWNKKKKEIVVGTINEKDEVTYQRRIMNYVDFKTDPNCCDILCANYLNQYKDSWRYSACAKFQAGVHKAGGLISKGTNIHHVTNDANCWPSYFEKYHKIVIPPRIGMNEEHFAFSEYLMNFSKVDEKEYEECMNKYFFDVADFLDKKGKNPDDIQRMKSFESYGMWHRKFEFIENNGEKIEIGRGGYGVVYLGELHPFGGKVAIKVSHKVHDEVGGERTKRLIEDDYEKDKKNEVNVIKHIQADRNYFKNNILYTYGEFKENGRTCIVSEYFPNGCLHSLIKNKHKHKITTEYKFCMCMNLIFGLIHLHSMGIINRDIKPKNILVGFLPGDDFEKYRDRVASYCDFGIAYFEKIQNIKDHIVGSPQYMAPEIFKGVKQTQKTDTYSLGLLLWCVLTMSDISETKGPKYGFPDIHDKRLLMIKGIINDCIKDHTKRPTITQIFQNNKDLILRMLTIYGGRCIKHASNEQKSNEIIFEMCMMVSKGDPGVFNQFTSKIKNKRLMLHVLKHNSSFPFHLIPQCLRDDREVLLEAIIPGKSNGGGIEIIDHCLRKDKSFVEMAVKKETSCFKHATEVLKDDKEFVKYLCKKYKGSSISMYMSERLKNDKEVITIAMDNNKGEAFKNASEVLKDDKEFVKYLCKKYPLTPFYMSKRLKNDKEVITIAMDNSKGEAFKIASLELKSDPELILKALKHNSFLFSYIPSGKTLQEVYNVNKSIYDVYNYLENLIRSKK